MQRVTRQQGSSLLLIIGVVAALAILFASLVVLTSNVLSNTSRERTRTKAFNVAEAGLDAGLYTLGHNWPGKDTTFTPTVDPAAFRAQFSTPEFPGPPSGSFIDVRFYDNYDTNGDGKIDLNDAPRDVGPGTKGDKLVFVDAQARVGKQVVRIRALAERQTVTLDLPRGVVLYAGGDLLMHGGGTPVGAEVLPQDATSVTAYINGTLTPHGSADFSSQVTPTQTGVPSLENMFNPEVLALLKEIAQDSGRYYTDAGAATAALATGQLVYFQATGAQTITANGVYNGDGVTFPVGAPKPPGVLIVDGGNVTFHGTPVYYGLVYCTGAFVDIGNAEIHGMVISASGVTELGGSDQVVYNDNCIMNLDEVVTLAAKVQKDSWRQLPPR
jgi:hypothetical protein